MTLKERDKEICRLYREEGMTQVEIAEKFEITDARIGQILKHGSVKTRDAKTSDLPPKVFIGAFVTPEVKEALKRECVTANIAMSTFISNVVTKELRDRGIDLEIKNYLKEEDVQLPLE